MKNNIRYIIPVITAISLTIACTQQKKDNTGHGILFRDVTLIDGKGGQPEEHTDILVQGDSIAEIGHQLDSTNRTVIHLEGKTIMPALISTHVHIGTLKGTTTKAENYTRENILSQTKKYGDYGVGNILIMGTDRPMLSESGLLDSSRKGLLPGARMYSAGYGFGVKNAAPPIAFGMDNVFRPDNASQVPAEMDSLLKIKPEMVKMWLDDFGGKFKKMDPAIYKAIIEEAHQRKLRVASHAYYLSDARKLVAYGVDVIGHSIRDSVIDDVLLKEMKAKNVVYIPTLSLDEFAYIYARKPEWINDPFFKNSLEPGVYEMITSPKYQDELKNSPAYAKNIRAFDIALKNLKKLFDAGILISMGTDSGAMPLRAQGFSEHLELELMVQAGLTPLEAIRVATQNSAAVLKIDKKFGTLEKGKTADFIILNANPAKDIKNTRSIISVYKDGKEISKGPLNRDN
ncbi:amidohydrolase family protein [Pedobacter sp. AW31-3R]|uniref:amidohydrolase family protein n=1 Tax=Pedobacter sp. AW31-3R TaxID=3445781 RepID=UPI003FA09DDE